MLTYRLGYSRSIDYNGINKLNQMFGKKYVKINDSLITLNFDDTFECQLVLNRLYYLFGKHDVINVGLYKGVECARYTNILIPKRLFNLIRYIASSKVCYNPLFNHWTSCRPKVNDAINCMSKFESVTIDVLYQ